MTQGEVSAWKERLEKIVQVLSDKVPAPKDSSVGIFSLHGNKYFVM